MEHLLRVPKMEVEEADLKVFSQDRFQQYWVKQFGEVPKLSSKDQTSQRTRDGFLDVPVPQFMEQLVNVPKIFFSRQNPDR